MSEKNNFTSYAQRLWKQTSVPARISAAIFGGISILAIGGIAYWAMQPHYVPLANNLNPQKAAEVVSLLDAEGIANKRNFSGTGILVDQSKWNKANSLISTVVSPDKVEPGGLGSSFLPDPDTKGYRLVRDLEKRLTSDIARFATIESATVNLGIPEPTPFVDQAGQKTAAINVKVQPGKVLERKIANAITSYVSRSVEGLSVENITLTDSKGNVFNADDSSIGSASSQFESIRAVENDLTRKAETMLDETLGYGRHVVRVSVDLDFTETKIRKKQLDKKGNLKKEETTETKTTSDKVSSLGGPAGTASNLGNSARTRRASDVLHDHQITKNEYEFGTTEEETTQYGGRIKRITVAASVQLADPVPNSDDPAASPSTEGAEPNRRITVEEVEELIKLAVGFDAARNDQIKVVDMDNLASDEMLTEFISPTTTVDTWMPLIRNGSLGIAALVALVLGLLTIKRINPVVVSDPPSQPTVTPERARQLSELSLLARKHPDVLANIMAAWAGEGATDDASKANESKAA